MDLGSLVHLIGSRKQRVQTGKKKGGVSFNSLPGPSGPHTHVRARKMNFNSTCARTSPHDLKEDAASAPHVHLEAVVAVGEETLGGSVPAGGDVFRVRGLGVNAATRAEVPELQAVLLQRSIFREDPRPRDHVSAAKLCSHLDQDVFRLHVSVKDPTAGRQQAHT